MSTVMADPAITPSISSLVITIYGRPIAAVGRWRVVCLEWNLAAEGKTYADAIENLRDVISVALNAARDQGDAVFTAFVSQGPNEATKREFEESEQFWKLVRFLHPILAPIARISNRIRQWRLAQTPVTSYRVPGSFLCYNH
jgi:hypothetical protein